MYLLILQAQATQMLNSWVRAYVTYVAGGNWLHGPVDLVTHCPVTDFTVS